MRACSSGDSSVMAGDYRLLDSVWNVVCTVHRAESCDSGTSTEEVIVVGLLRPAAAAADACGAPHDALGVTDEIHRASRRTCGPWCVHPGQRTVGPRARLHRRLRDPREMAACPNRQARNRTHGSRRPRDHRPVRRVDPPPRTAPVSAPSPRRPPRRLRVLRTRSPTRSTPPPPGSAHRRRRRRAHRPSRVGVGSHYSVVGADQGFRAPSWDQESVRDSVTLIPRDGNTTG